MYYNWDWNIFLTPVASGGATYLDWLASGLYWTVVVSLSGWVIALVLGSMLGVMRTVPNRFASAFATSYVEIFRNVPLLVQLFLWYFVVPELLPKTLGDAIKQMHPALNAYLTASVCLGFFTAARVCEQVRAGIQSLPRGQTNAALALGFTLPQTYRHLLLPMAFRIIIPPLTSEFLNIFKNSSVALTISLLELTAQSRQISEYTAHPFEAFIAATLLYLAITFVVMIGMRVLEHRVRVPGYIGAQ
jgi:glutamate/aspartate transport system permease protein